MARPKASEQRDTRAEILAAALELFATKGLHGTSVRDIARAVGVRESTLYNHFESKEALFDAVIFAPDADDRPLVGPPAFPRFEGEAAELPAFLAEVLLGVTERFGQPDQRARFRILLSDGVRMAQAGQMDPFARMFALREPALALMQSLLDRGLVRGPSAEVLLVQFVAPVFVWRVFDAVVPDGAPRAARELLIRTHVQTFLHGCAVEETR